MNTEQLIAELKQCEQDDDGQFIVSEDLICGLVSFLERLCEKTVEE